jgi:hypothetical protein
MQDAGRCGDCDPGVPMRKVFLAGLAAPIVFFLTVPAMAETALGIACREYATAVADDYMSDQLVRLDGSEVASEGHVIVHSYGRKYLMPNRAAGEGPLVRKSIGTATREWGQVYTEERRRCLRKRMLGEFLAGN